LSALEWGKITARLSVHASSEPGRDLCAALFPGTDLDAIRVSLEENRDGRRMLLQDGALPLDEAKEIREEVGKAAKGASLSPTELLRIGKTARVGERVRRFFEDRRGRYPRLARHANGIPPLRDLAEAVEQAIDAGEAEPGLRPVRYQCEPEQDEVSAFQGGTRLRAGESGTMLPRSDYNGAATGRNGGG